MERSTRGGGGKGEADRGGKEEMADDSEWSMVLVLFIQSERETEGEDANLTKRLNDFTSLLAGEILSSQSPQRREGREGESAQRVWSLYVFSRVRVKRDDGEDRHRESHEETQRCEFCQRPSPLSTRRSSHHHRTDPQGRKEQEGGGDAMPTSPSGTL
jgi:hypothetical protein